MAHRFLYFCVISLVLWGGCSGTEFPNPGNDKEDNEMMLAENSDTSNGASEAIIASSSIENRQRFYQYIVNECVQTLQPDFEDGSTFPRTYVQIQSTESAVQSSAIFSDITRPTIPAQFSVVQTAQENGGTTLEFTEEGSLAVSFQWQIETLSSTILAQDLGTGEVSIESSLGMIENCQQTLNIEELLNYHNEQVTVLHQQHTYQTSDLPSNLLITVDRYRDKRLTNASQTLQFELTFSSVNASSNADSETYRFQLQTVEP